MTVNWKQVKAVLWLRSRLTRNQWERSPFGGVLAALMAVGAVLTALVVGGLSFAAGAFALEDESVRVVSGVYLAATLTFVFFWSVGILQELQRSEIIDLPRLMHLPVQLRDIFVINYLASHATLSVNIFVPLFIGLSAGLAVSHGLLMLMLIPVALSMMLMISAWTYYLRGWLGTLISNPRRKRTILGVATVLLILVPQLPNFYFNIALTAERPGLNASRAEWARFREERNAREEQTWALLERAEKYVPPLWVAVGAGGAATGNALPAVGSFLGCLALAGLGLRRAYRSSVRFYQAEEQSESPKHAEKLVAPPPGISARATGPSLVERRVSFLPDDAASVMLATLRSLTRAPEVRIALLSTIAFMGLFAFAFARRLLHAHPSEITKPLFVAGLIGISTFTSSTFFVNQFGYDRQGFRAYVLSPVPRKYILLGKNLATAIVPAGLSLTLLAIAAFLLHLSAIDLLAALFQIATALLIWMLVGNWLSIIAAYRVRFGAVRRSEVPGHVMLLSFALLFLFPIFMSPVVIPALVHWLFDSFVSLNLLLSVLFAVLTAALYARLLEPLGALLQAREIVVLEAVATDIE